MGKNKYRPLPDLPRISRAEFVRRLKNTKHEDWEVIQTVERLLKKKRGYINKMPKPGSNVILLFSGGLDSTVAWEYLINKYNYQVYPLSSRGSKLISGQSIAIGSVSKYICNKYPNHYHRPVFTQGGLLNRKLNRAISNPTNIYYKYIANQLEGSSSRAAIFTGSNHQAALKALFYAHYLRFYEDLKIDTIFSGILADDGVVAPSQKYTMLKIYDLFLYNFFNDFNIQYLSLFYNITNRHYLTKLQLTCYAVENNLPIYKTFSCANNGLISCGQCICCKVRHNCITKCANKDHSIYLKDIKILHKTQTLLRLADSYVKVIKRRLCI